MNDEVARQLTALEEETNTDGDETDPYAEDDEWLRRISEERDVDLFELFILSVLEPAGRSERTKKKYRTTYSQWREFMEGEDRHPAAMNLDHVKRFITFLQTEKGNNSESALRKVKRLNYTFEFWCDQNALSYSQDYNPFQLALKWSNLKRSSPKKPPNIPIEEMTEIVQNITHIETRAIVVLMLKLGLRASEVCNMKASDLNFQNPEMKTYYPDFGTHPEVKNRENAVYIPPKVDNDLGIPGRQYNKSGAPRVLPIDGDTQFVLETYLITRPKVDQEWVFINRRFNRKFNPEHINERWKEVFHPEYAETEYTRGVTSHFGRHYFTTWWRSEKQLDRDLVKYMRGDVSSVDENGNQVWDESIDKYIHTQYEHVEQAYRDHIYWFGLGNNL